MKPLKGGRYALSVIQAIDPTPIIFVKAETPRESLGEAIRDSLGVLWERVRNQKIEGAGRNLIIYDDFKDGLLHIRAGIKLADNHGLSESQIGWTPSGKAAVCIHTGDYTGIPLANKAIEEYCAENKMEKDCVSWEVYGHWTEDPNQLTTEVIYLLK